MFDFEKISGLIMGKISASLYGFIILGYRPHSSSVTALRRRQLPPGGSHGAPSGRPVGVGRRNSITPLNNHLLLYQQFSPLYFSAPIKFFEKPLTIGDFPDIIPTLGPVVQSVSTPACHAGGRRFESVPGRHENNPHPSGWGLFFSKNACHCQG